MAAFVDAKEPGTPIGDVVELNAVANGPAPHVVSYSFFAIGQDAELRDAVVTRKNLDECIGVRQ